MVQRVYNVSGSGIAYDLATLWSNLPNNGDLLCAFNYNVSGGRRTGIYTKYSGSYGWIMIGHYSNGVHLYSVNNNVFTQIV